MDKSIKISKISFYLFFLSLISTIFGFLREIFLAYKFGATSITDSYLVAVAPLSIIIYFLKSSEIAFTSLFSQKLVKNKKKAWQWASQIINSILIIIFLLTLIYLFLAPFIAKILAPGFDSQNLSLTTLLIRISVPVFIFVTIYSFIKGILNSYHRFLSPEISSLFPNLGIILGIIFFSIFWGIKGVIFGLLIGYFLQLIIPLFQIRKFLVKNYSFKKTFNYPEVKNFLFYSIFLILILLGLNIDTVADKIFGSYLPTGSITALNYARKIIASIYFLIAYSFSTTLLPILSKYKIKNQKAQFKQKFNQALKMIFFLLIPVSVLIFLLRIPLLSVLFKHGLFGDYELKITSEILAIYSGAILSLAGITFLARVFYALNKVKIPALIGFLIMIFNIICDFILIRYFSYKGLALATLLASNLNFLLLLIYLNYSFKIINFKEWSYFLIKILGIISIMSIFIFITNYLFLNNLSDNFINQIFKLLFLGGEGIIIFIIFAYIFKLRELNNFKLLLLNLINYDH